MRAIHKQAIGYDHIPMNHRKALGNAIKRFRKIAGLTQPDLAEQTSIDQSAISRIENGKQGIADDQMMLIAKAVRVHVSEIWAAVEDATKIAEEGGVYRLPIPSGARMVPLIGWVQAGRWTEAHSPTDPQQATASVLTSAKVSHKAFALEVKGDSMINPRGEPSFPPGVRLIVEPNAVAYNGSLVIAQIDGDAETTFKKLVIDGGKHYLVPLNPQFPTLPIDRSVRICGVVVTIAEKQLEDGEWA